MLSSSFAENGSSLLLPGDRKVYTIVVEEADFVTIYWLLKWVYANWLLFRREDDPRQAVDGVGAGWSARGFSYPGSPDEWEWKVFPKGGAPMTGSDAHSDARSVTSGGSGPSITERSRGKEKEGVHPAQGASMRSTHAAKNAPSTPARQGPSQPRRAVSGSAPTLAPPPTSARASKTAPVPVPLSPSSSKNPYGHRVRTATMDPHAHPTAAPAPASALCMYQVAHRYGMPGLASLALEHIVSTITPRSSFAVLLAASTWDELRLLIEVRDLRALMSIECQLTGGRDAGLCSGEVGGGVGVGRV